MSEIAACPPSPLLTILQLYHFPPPLPPPGSNSSFLFTRCQPLCASCCTGLLYCSRYCTVRFKIFSLFFVFVFMYYLGEKYYKPITVQYYIADCVSWAPGLTLLDLWMCSWNETRSYVRDLLYLQMVEDAFCLVHFMHSYKCWLFWGTPSACGQEWEMYHGMGWRVGLEDDRDTKSIAKPSIHSS